MVKAESESRAPLSFGDERQVPSFSSQVFNVVEPVLVKYNGTFVPCTCVCTMVFSYPHATRVNAWRLKEC